MKGGGAGKRRDKDRAEKWKGREQEKKFKD